MDPNAYTEQVMNALRDLKDALTDIITDDDGMIVDGPSDPDDTFTLTVSRADLQRASDAWGAAVGIVGRHDRPAQYRPIGGM